MITEGESAQPSFSPDGERLIFVSANRVGHSLPQVYEKNLSTGAERRITYQSGQTSRPTYHPKLNMIAYASSTDEWREQPPRNIPDPTPSKLPGEYQALFEVYVHNLNALDISRLSKHSGFDGEPHFHRDGSLTYTQAGKEALEVVSIKPYGAGNQVLSRLGKNVSSYVSSADGKVMAWLEWDKEFQKSILKVQKAKAKIFDTKADTNLLKQDLELSADGQWLFWSQTDNKGLSSIWVMDTETYCPRMLIGDEKVSVRHPTLSPHQKTLAYTHLAQSRSRIAWRTFSLPSGSCPTGL